MRPTDTITDTASQTSAALGDTMQLMNDVIGQAGSSVGGVLPKIVGALVILLGGFFLAKVISWVVGSIFKKTGLGEKVASLIGQTGSAANKSVGRSAAKVTFYTVMAFVVLAVLKVLNLDAISGPITGLIDDFFAFIPSAVGALIVLAVFGFIAKIAATLTKTALLRVGFDTIITTYTKEPQADGKYACYAGKLVSGLILFTGFTQAVDTLGLEILSNLVNQIWAFTAPLFVGTVIAVVGVIGAGKLSELVATLLPEKDGAWAAPLIKFGTIALAGIVGLRQTGLVDNLVDTIVPIVVGGFVLAVVVRYAVNGPDAIKELSGLVNTGCCDKGEGDGGGEPTTPEVAPVDIT